MRHPASCSVRQRVPPNSGSTDFNSEDDGGKHHAVEVTGKPAKVNPSDPKVAKRISSELGSAREIFSPVSRAFRTHAEELQFMIEIPESSLLPDFVLQLMHRARSFDWLNAAA